MATLSPCNKVVTWQRRVVDDDEFGRARKDRQSAVELFERELISLGYREGRRKTPDPEASVTLILPLNILRTVLTCARLGSAIGQGKHHGRKRKNQIVERRTNAIISLARELKDVNIKKYKKSAKTAHIEAARAAHQKGIERWALNRDNPQFTVGFIMNRMRYKD